MKIWLIVWILFCFTAAIIGIKENEIMWNDFLASIYDFFKDPKIQKNINVYNVRDMADWGLKKRGVKDHFPPITDDNFKKFFDVLNKSEPQKFEKYKCFLGPRANISSRYDDINEIVKQTLDVELQAECVENRLIITGNIVRASAVKIPIQQDCFQQKQGHRKPKVIEILASYSFYLDTDIDLFDKYAMLSIVTKNFYVVGNDREINLNGQDAQDAVPSNNTEEGISGEPGPPGETAGSFYLIAKHYPPSAQMKILANGGRGGRGSDGTKGRNGSDGNPGTDKDYNRAEYEPPCWLFCRYRYPGWPGEQGHKGAEGGAGGIGGNVGYVRHLYWGGAEYAAELRRRAGIGGKGGVGGWGGKHGATMVYPRTIFRGVDWERKVNGSECYDNKLISKGDCGPKGPRGDDGANTRHRKQPLPQIVGDHYEVFTLPDYFKLLLDSLKKKPLQQNAMELAKWMLTSKYIKKRCNITCFVDMYVALEQRFHFLHDVVNTTVLYNCFLEQHKERVNDINKNLTKTDEVPPDTIKVLYHLFTSIKAKLFSFKEHVEERFIANLNDFLNMFIEKLNKWKEIKREVGVAEANKAYKKDIDDQIEDANNIIESNLIPEMEQMDKNFDIAIAEIYKEIAILKRDSQNAIARNAEERVRLKHAFIFKMFGQVLKGIGMIASCVATVFGGPVAGAAVSAGTNLVAGGISNAAGSTDANIAGANLDASKLKQSVNYFKKKLSDRRKIADQHVKEILDTIDKASEIYTEIKSVATDVKNYFANEGKALLDGLTNKLGGNICIPGKQFADKFRGMLNTGLGKFTQSGIGKSIQKFTSSPTFQKIGTVAKTAVELVEWGLTTASEIDKYGKSIKELDKKEEKLKEDLKTYKKVEESIENEVGPLLHGMSDSLVNMTKQLQGKNTFQLDLQQMNVEKYLKTVVAQVSVFTAHFKAGEKVMATIETMKAVINKIFNIMQKIAHMEQKKDLANYMAALNAPALSSTTIVDPELKQSITKLLMTIDANVILTDYKIWLKQMKLFVFPLAETYMQSYDVPDVLKPKETTVEGYLHTAVKEVERFRMQYIESNVYVTGYDSIKHRALFYRHTVNGPFVVWKNSEFEDPIARLLGGQKSYLEALAISSKLNAVKFRRIDLYIRAKNVSRQPELDEILKQYVVKMKHTGSNYYNCDNKTYLAMVGGQEFQFSYQYLNNEPVDKNLVYDKILHGDYMLSPYTTWKIQLVKKNISNYHALSKFRREVDVELVGEGEYFEEGASVCLEDLSKYFEMADQREPRPPKKVKPFTCPPPEPPPPGGYLFCEMNNDFDLNWWCRAIVRKFDGPLVGLKHTAEDPKYFYYDEYFKRDLIEKQISGKIQQDCKPKGRKRYNGNCMAKFLNRPRNPPWQKH